MEISFIFLIIGMIIVIGFFGSLSFEKTKVPDVLILLGIGVLLGPVFRVVSPESLTHFAEYFGSLALMIILFEGGMDMDIDKLLKELGTAFILVSISFVLSAVIIAGYLYFVSGWSIIKSALLGLILGCTSAAIVIPIISKMSLKEEVKTILSVESALSDVLAVVLTVSLIEFIKLEDIGMETPFRAVASSFSVAIVSGIVAGLFWLKMLDYFKELKYSYMLTVAAMLIIFASVNFLGGSGPIAILIYGVILGNSHDFNKFLKLKRHAVVDDTIRFFHSEVTFFIRTFFFVYMGMMLSFNIINQEFLILTASLLLIVFVARYISISIIGLIYREKREDRHVMLAMLPRGLASAVLATLPLSANIKGGEGLIDYTFAIIVLTNIIMTIGVFSIEKKSPKAIKTG